MTPHFLKWSFGPKIESVDGICQQTDSRNRFYLDVKTEPKADSYAYEKFIRKWTKYGVFFGTKNMSEGHLMHTVLVCYAFDKLGQACLCG